MQHVGWFVLRNHLKGVEPYKYGDVFLSIYSKQEEKKAYTDKGCTLVPVYVKQEVC